jgi:signal transduction histidine kinase
MGTFWRFTGRSNLDTFRHITEYEGPLGDNDDKTLGRSFAAALPPDEKQRLAALRSYGILDTPKEAAFDDITRIASYVCGTPIALVSLLDENRQWFKSEVGAGMQETPRDVSMCAHAVLQPGLTEVPDTRLDRRFDRNPLVTGDPHLRFYAGALLRTPEGHALGTVCVLDTKPRNLTPEQRAVLLALARQTMAQLELRRALMVAHRLQGYRSRLMAVAGHDLKQPLQVIMMSVDGVRRRIADGKDRERLELALNAGQQLADGLDQLAEESRLEDASGTPQVREFPVQDLFNSILATWRHHAERKGLKIKVAHSSARIVSDPVMLGTIVSNLIGNAIKYTASGGLVIGCRRRGDMLAIEVRDTGPGILEENYASVFEHFRQLDPTSEGLGLGLSIVKRTADLLGHPLQLESRVGRGSTFRIMVPLARGRPKPA